MRTPLRLLLALAAPLLFLAPCAQAESSILKLSHSDYTTVRVKGPTRKADVRLMHKATHSGTGTVLTSVGQGIRTKDVFGGVNVYAGQFLAQNPEQFPRPGHSPSNYPINDLTALRAMDRMGMVALHITMAVDVPTKTILDGFVSSMGANNLPSNQQHLRQFLVAVELVGKKYKRGKEVVILGQSEGGKDYITFEYDGKVLAQRIPGPDGFVQEVMAIWLGRMADPGLGDLKRGIIFDAPLD